MTYEGELAILRFLRMIISVMLCTIENVSGDLLIFYEGVSEKWIVKLANRSDISAAKD